MSNLGAAIKTAALARYAITPAGRAALEAHPRCQCGEPATGEVWVRADISHWKFACELAVETEWALGSIVRRWEA